MRLRIGLIVAALGVALLWPAVAAATTRTQTQWNDYVSSADGWAVRYPIHWHVNQGDLGPLPAPTTTKFSTYTANAGAKIALTADDAEVWIMVTDAASTGNVGADFARAGYAERKMTIAGLPATRYTAAQPAFGVYDAVILPAQGHVYRIYLSASTHAFDDVFQTMLDAFSISVSYHSGADFAARYPVSWTLREEDGEVSFAPADADGQARVSVQYAESARSVEDYLTGRLEQMASAGAIEKLDKQTAAMTLGGAPALGISYRYTRKSDGLEIRGVDAGVKVSNLMYVVGYRAPAAQYERWLPAFEQFVKDFRLYARVTLADVLAQPQSYADAAVTLAGDFLGWRKPATTEAAAAAPPVTRSDWLLQDKNQVIYAQANVSLSADSLALDPSVAGDPPRRVRVVALVRQTEKGQPYLEPWSIYPQLAGAWVRRDVGGSALALELSQAGAMLYGQARLGAAGVAPRPIAGAVVKGDALRVRATDGGPSLEIEGTLAADGRSLHVTLSQGSAAAEQLSLSLGEPALPMTGAALSDAPVEPLIMIGMLLLLAGALGFLLTLAG